MNRPGSIHPSALIGAIATMMFLAAGQSFVIAAAPYTEATVTRVQNKVNYGEQKGGQSVTRPAATQDVIRARNFLLSEGESRAELQYPDGTIVRIGQNTVFSFEADTRTLHLTKGTFIFYVPHGLGGATIKTPSLTAAITGTCGFAAANGITDKIGIVNGSAMTSTGDAILTNQYASKTGGGPTTVNPITGNWSSGVLWTFNGPLPPFREATTPGLVPDLSILLTQDALDKTANHPNALGNFFPKVDDKKHEDKGKPKVFVATPTPRPTPTPKPTPRVVIIDGGEGEVVATPRATPRTATPRTATPPTATPREG